MRYIHSMETILDGELSLRDLSKLQRKLSWVWTQSKNVQPLTFDFQIILCQLWLVSWDFSFSFFFFFGKAASGHEQGSKISKDFFFYQHQKKFKRSCFMLFTKHFMLWRLQLSQMKKRARPKDGRTGSSSRLSVSILRVVSPQRASRSHRAL